MTSVQVVVFLMQRLNLLYITYIMNDNAVYRKPLLQLRVRDLEGALEVEKSANDEANKAIDRLTKQIKELEMSYESERKNGRDVSNKLEK